MSKKPTEIVGEIVDMLSPLPSEDRQRIIQASLTMLGESPLPAVKVGTKATTHLSGTEDLGLPDKAQIWMQQNDLSLDLLQQSFHLKPGDATVIAEPPGLNKREKTLNAYILTGIASLLATGEGTFSDEAARLLCVNSGCHDASNHAAILKNKGNEFTGNKTSGWSLTAPGLKRAAAMVKDMANAT